jgi:hypothetical protein
LVVSWNFFCFNLSLLFRLSGHLWCSHWLEGSFLKITFGEKISCDIEEIRQLIDEVTYDPAHAIVQEEGEE